jgi:hypothetical protein
MVEGLKAAAVVRRRHEAQSAFLGTISPKTSRNVYCMETVDLTDGFDHDRIAQSWENLSADHSIQIGESFTPHPPEHASIQFDAIACWAV